MSTFLVRVDVLRICKFCEVEFDKINMNKRNVCPKCEHIYNKEYRLKNKERIYLQRKKYRELNRGTIKEKKHLAHLGNKEYNNLKSKERYWNNIGHNRELSRQYYQEHKDLWRGYADRRKLERRIDAINRNKLKRTLGQDLTLDEINEMQKQQDNKCFYCDKRLNSYHIEHIIPISKGGEHKSYNIVLACPKCNLSKRDQNPEEFVNKILSEVI